MHGGIIEEPSGGSIWRKHLEAYGRHLGGTWEAPERHSGRLGHRRQLGGKCAQNMWVLLSKEARASVSRRRERTDPHEVPRLRTKVCGRSASEAGKCCTDAYQHRQDPYSSSCLGELHYLIWCDFAALEEKHCFWKSRVFNMVRVCGAGGETILKHHAF